jgi:hypothetical protein
MKLCRRNAHGSPIDVLAAIVCSLTSPFKERGLKVKPSIVVVGMLFAVDLA